MNKTQQSFDLSGKTAIVTGASKGIGLAMATALAEAGASVMICSRKKDQIEEVANDLKAIGLQVSAIACNVSSPSDQKALIDATLATFGRIDVLINNAATNPYFGPIEELDHSAYQKTMDVNLNAAIQLSNLAYEPMKKNGGGSIIHVSSIEGIHGSAMFSAYNLSKAALIMLGKSQAAEWGKDHIRVNTICPGLVKTKLSQMLWSNEKVHDQIIQKIPLGRMAQPSELGGIAVFLASDASSYMTGSNLVIDGGLLNGPLL